MTQIPSQNSSTNILKGGKRLSGIEKTSPVPVISIITVVYNGEAHLEQTIESVISQDYPNFEYIIVDGGSQDQTLEIVKRHQSQIDYWISEPDKGIYNAMNKGIALAKGEIIGILNSDDYYQENTVSKVVECFAKTKADIVHGNVDRLNEIKGKKYFITVTPNLERLNQTMTINHPACFVKKKVYKKIGGFDESFRLAADYEFLLRAYKQNCQFHHLDQSLTVFRIGGESSIGCDSLKETHRLSEKHNTGYQNQIKLQLYKCYLKAPFRALLYSLTKLFHLQFLFDKRIENRWKKMGKYQY